MKELLNRPKSHTSTHGTKGAFFQPKLTVNQPGDPFEQEADAMADRVMRMTSREMPVHLVTRSEFMQRKCAGCEEEEKLQKKDSTASQNLSISGSLISTGSPGGSPLPDPARKFFEPRFGYDFSDVRVHHDAAAAASAQSINALAYTMGNNIVFNHNQYSPESESGKKLLAHELTHVIQQKKNSGIGLRFIQRQTDRDLSILDDEQLMNEYESYRDYMQNLDPEKYAEEEGNMSYLLELEREVRRRCIKGTPVHPKDVGQKLIDRITGKYASIDGDPGEGLFLTPYLAPEGQCTIGYGHVIFPKSLCTIESYTDDKGKEKKRCICQPPWNAISKKQAIDLLKQDIQTHVREVNKKIKVDLNQDQFDAMVDLSAHIGSLPSDFVDYVHEHWCTNNNAVRNRYLQTAIKMKDPDTKRMKVMKNFVERRKRRAW